MRFRILGKKYYYVFSFSDAPQGYDCALRSSFLQMSPLGCGNSHQGAFEFVKCLESIKKFEDSLTFSYQKTRNDSK